MLPSLAPKEVGEWMLALTSWLGCHHFDTFRLPLYWERPEGDGLDDPVWLHTAHRLCISLRWSLQQEMQCSRHHLTFVLLDSPDTARIHSFHPFLYISSPSWCIATSPSSPTAVQIHTYGSHKQSDPRFVSSLSLLFSVGVVHFCFIFFAMMSSLTL